MKNRDDIIRDSEIQLKKRLGAKEIMRRIIRYRFYRKGDSIEEIARDVDLSICTILRIVEGNTNGNHGKRRKPGKRNIRDMRF